MIHTSDNFSHDLPVGCDGCRVPPIAQVYGVEGSENLLSEAQGWPQVLLGAERLSPDTIFFYLKSLGSFTSRCLSLSGVKRS